ncbi:MAG: 4-alpha-glucanotransferase [Rubricella sp.]
MRSLPQQHVSRAAFDAWRREEGAPLERFALHQALSDLHGPYWSSWPIALRDPDSAEVREAAQALAPEIAFHAWAQYEAERQLRAAGERARMAGAEYGLYLDLAVGTHPFGAETWDDRSAFAFGASLGAPPDAFSADGQAWGVAPFNPRTLIETGFAALAETLRRQMRFARLIRIDHILGFDRAFWVPEEPGLPGAYVKMPLDAMLAVVRMEAARAGAVVVGEDLGNIPDGLQAALDASGILGCRLIAFERDADAGFSFRLPEDYDAEALASFATHDLPTWAGWRKGFEIETRHALGLIDGETRAAIQAERARECAAFAAAGGGDTAAPDGMHAFLARTRSRLAAVQAEDILALEEQPNLPGTTTEYPNWRRRLPVCAAAFARNETLARAAAFMEEAGRGPHRQSETEQEPTWN